MQVGSLGEFQDLVQGDVAHLIALVAIVVDEVQQVELERPPFVAGYVLRIYPGRLEARRLAHPQLRMAVVDVRPEGEKRRVVDTVEAGAVLADPLMVVGQDIAGLAKHQAEVLRDPVEPIGPSGWLLIGSQGCLLIGRYQSEREKL